MARGRQRDPNSLQGIIRAIAHSRYEDQGLATFTIEDLRISLNAIHPAADYSTKQIRNAINSLRNQRELIAVESASPGQKASYALIDIIEKETNPKTIITTTAESEAEAIVNEDEGSIEEMTVPQQTNATNRKPRVGTPEYQIAEAAKLVERMEKAAAQIIESNNKQVAEARKVAPTLDAKFNATMRDLFALHLGNITNEFQVANGRTGEEGAAIRRLITDYFVGVQKVNEGMLDELTSVREALNTLGEKICEGFNGDFESLKMEISALNNDLTRAITARMASASTPTDANAILESFKDGIKFAMESQWFAMENLNNKS